MSRYATTLATLAALSIDLGQLQRAVVTELGPHCEPSSFADRVVGQVDASIEPDLVGVAVRTGRSAFDRSGVAAPSSELLVAAAELATRFGLVFDKFEDIEKGWGTLYFRKGKEIKVVELADVRRGLTVVSTVIPGARLKVLIHLSDGSVYAHATEFSATTHDADYADLARRFASRVKEAVKLGKVSAQHVENSEHWKKITM
jgi:hypothetical protein